MASFKGNGREDQKKRRSDDSRRRRQGLPILESLEERRLLATTGTTWHPTTTNLLDAEHGPMADMGQEAVKAYSDYLNYENAGAHGQFTTSLYKRIEFINTSIGMDIRGTGDFASFQKAMTSLGMHVTSTDPSLKIVEGFIPLNVFPAVAEQAQVIGGEPIYWPTTKFVGAANNEAGTTLGADAARAAFGVTGAGQKVGVLSDSVSQFGNGLADSVATGDLPNNVQVIQDGPAGSTDEGRAMLENIHDIAPGASLAFATGAGGQVAFSNNIVNLANAGATIITDDLGYPDELFFQDGTVQQGINTVTSRGIPYTSAAGNSADSGYLSNFRGVNTTVPGIGAGRFQNFDPTGATTAPTITIEVYSPTSPTFEFDQPVLVGSNGVVSQVNFYVLDQNNNVVGSGTSNNVASGQPIQFLIDAQGNFVTLQPGTYKVAIQVASGPDPGHVEFVEPGDGGFNVDHQFGSAGGTFYPTTHGHSAGAATIGVGAVPWFDAPPFLTPPILHNEDYSSFGPELSLFNPDGTPKVAQTLLKPDLSGADGGNTSFFNPGEIINTLNNLPNPGHPPFTGQPPTTIGQTPTTTNLSQNLPSFFGTSSAAPNVAAVIALMKQANPALSNAQVLNALITSATPLNGAAKGVWNQQGGFGLVNASAAIIAAQQLKVVFISPGASQTLTAAPTSITVTFSQPINLSTVTSGNLKVTGPNGSIVTVGQPIGVDSVTFPTVIRFPIAISVASGLRANGVFHDQLLPTGIVGLNGQKLSGVINDQFNVQQVNGPSVISTSFVGRIVNLTFNEAVNPATVNASSFYLFRAGGVNNSLFNANDIIVSSLPGAVISFNVALNTATIDLTGVPQSSLPTDHYALVATSAITDLVGNPLNGAFSGVFPSGTNPEGINGSNFIQDLGIVQLTAPIVSSLVLAPFSDSGIQGDNNTNNSSPSFIGQVTSRFPGSLAGDTVFAEFNGITHQGVARGGTDLAVGAGGRGFVGHFDVQTVTNALGQFVITLPAGVTLPEGQNRIRIVVVGQPDSPPFPGFSSFQDLAFRIDHTGPYVGTTNGTQATSIPENANISSLTSLTLNIVDPVNPPTLGDPFAVDPKLAIPALNPILADNVNNYKLFRVTGPSTHVDVSSFITSATFVSTSARVLSSDPFTGQVVLTFAPGLTQGRYFVVALSSAFGNGLTDAAGNPFAGYKSNSTSNNPANFQLDFNLQPTPTYITSYVAYTGLTTSGPRADYELPVAGQTPRALAPPNGFTIDFSNPLMKSTPGGAPIDYSKFVQLVRSANSANATPDGDFGDLGITNTTGFTPITGLNVTLTNSIAGAVFGQYGFQNRLLITLPAGLTLPADDYRIYLQNAGATPILDVFGNQLDGEFLGYQNGLGKYVDQLQTGQVRGAGGSELPDLTGDGTNGGAFMTGFVVVPNGGIIYARADTLYNPQIPSERPDGSLTRPFPVLAPEAVPNAVNGGDLNSVVNSGANFNPTFDRNGDGQFEPSAFFAAQQFVQATGGPVVVEAEASIPSRDPATGAQVQKPFILEAPSPSGNGAITAANDASAAVPAMTTLIFDGGTILKMQNAALLVQNQGSALQINGGPNTFQTVNVTSYKDSSLGGVSNGDPTSKPSPGDYGGIVFRNFSQAALPGGAVRTSLFPGQIPITGNPALDGRLKGPFADPNNPNSQVDAISGADDIMSYVSFLSEKFAGGAVPQTVGTRYDGITMKNSRPTIVNSIIADSGGAGSAQAGLSVDVDSLRADGVAQGPLLRNDLFFNNGLNGIYIRAEVASGLAQPTNAIGYPTNPTSAGGERNYVLDDPYPYILTSQMQIGTTFLVDSGTTGNNQSDTADRLYIDPGMLVKFELGAWLQIDANASLVVGDQTYIKNFDADHTYGPTFAQFEADGVTPNPLAGQVNPNFKANSAGLAQVIFTALNDDTASTSFFDPISQTRTTVVQALPAVFRGAGNPPPVLGKGAWGGLLLRSGSIDTVNSAVFRFGGGIINTPTGSGTIHVLEINPENGTGANVEITNNVFTQNADVAIETTPNAIEAGDPTRPLESGDPFIHGNVFQNNGLNGVGIAAGGPGPNLLVDSVWTGGDFTYILRSTVILGPGVGSNPNQVGIPLVPPGDRLVAEPPPNVTLTLQSTLPGTILADGTTVAAPGIPLIIKLQGGLPSETVGVSPAPNAANSSTGGAGFIVGVDNGVDPQSGNPLVDGGAFSDIRILGIGANQTTGQTRVPVIITSIHDATVGTTVNGVQMNQAITGDGAKPAAGDGGIIYFGGNSLTDYALQDSRSGNLIDNADIRYITRIEQQGGGIIYGFDVNNSGAFSGATYQTKLGLSEPGTVGFEDQYNQAKQLTISNSNLSTFSDAGFIAHPGYQSIILAGNFVNTTGVLFRIPSGYLGEATHTYFVNDTITNMPNVGAEIISETLNQDQTPSPAMAVFLNNTFYNNGTGISTVAPVANGINPNSHVSFLAMDNIFSNTKGNAIQSTGQNYGDEVQYNLFNLNGANLTLTTPSFGTTNDQPILGNPAFRDAANGNFFLLPSSAAIDVSRSELGPSIFGDMLYPAVTIDPNNLNSIPIRNQIGDVNPFGGLGNAPLSTDIVTLPGENFEGTITGVAQRGFPDQWIPVLASSGQGFAGTSTNPATYVYVPITGERDQAGNLRVKDPFTLNPPGFGSRPFFDVGAFEFIVQNPPIVEGVAANITNPASPTGTSPINIYGVGVIAGTNKIPQSISIAFNEQLNPATLNGLSVILEASGGNGIFGDANSPADRFINLAGLLSFNSVTDILTINTSGIFLVGATLNDEYRLILKGTGSAVIRDKNGLALDGLNLDANGNQLPLPSGADQFPGSDFVVTFTIDTNTPKIKLGTFVLDPASDSSGGRNITNVTNPTFDGSILDVFPPINAVAGQKIFLDVSSQGNGVFDEINAGVGTTDANGNFKITLTTAIPNTPNTVAPDGIQGDAGSTFAEVRVRIVNQAGNASNQPTDPFLTYLNEGAITFLQEDTKSPQVTAITPTSGAVVTSLANGQVTVSVTFNKNIKPSTINANSILIQRSGGTGSFANPINVPIQAGSLTETFLKDATGSELVTFNLAGPLPNDQFRIILKGTGPNAITDIPGNRLNGGTDVVNGPFVVYSPSAAHLLYVQAPTVPPVTVSGALGTRSNPFATIGAAMGQALIGDDVLVLPGVYREDVTLKAGVRLLSAALSSTNTSFTPGIPNQTLIYGVVPPVAGVPVTNPPGPPTPLAPSNNNIVTIFTTGAVTGIPTEISGFSIISPLIGNSVLGTIDPTNTGIQAVNSNVSIDRNNIINAGIGVNLGTSGANAPTAQVFDNVIAGNIKGVGISDTNATSSISGPFMIVNNTIADNTYGLYNVSASPNVLQADVLNNIFYSNHDLTTQRNGTGILSLTANTLGVGSNLFFGNGASATKPASNALGSFVNFNPAALTATPDGLGNLLSNPLFVQAEDPRPNGDTPPSFFNFGNFDLTGKSLAINAANGSVAPATDFLYRTPVRIAGHGFPDAANSGPASIGAFYFMGSGGPTTTTGQAAGSATGTTTSSGGTTGGTVGSPSGTTTTTGGTSGHVLAAAFLGTGPTVGAGNALGSLTFHVITTSLSDDGSLHAAGLSEAPPSYIDVNFSDNINPAMVSSTDLAISGSGLSTTNPAKATGLAWIDDHAIRFFLSGGFNNSGTVNVSIPQGAMTDTTGNSLIGFGDSFQLGNPATPVTTATPGITATPVATAAPVATATTAFATSLASPAIPASVALPVVQPIAAPGPVAIPMTVAISPAKQSITKTVHVATTKTSSDHHTTVKVTHKATPKPSQVTHKATPKPAPVIHKAAPKPAPVAHKAAPKPSHVTHKAAPKPAHVTHPKKAK